MPHNTKSESSEHMSKAIDRISMMLNILSDPNDPRGGSTYAAILREDMLSVSQALIGWFLDLGRIHNKTPNEWRYAVEGFCWWLGREGSEILAQTCTPSLISLLNLPCSDRTPDPTMILSVFERLGARNYLDLIPALINLIWTNFRPEYTEDAWEVLLSFDKEALAPYQTLIDRLPPLPPKMSHTG